MTDLIPERVLLTPRLVGFHPLHPELLAQILEVTSDTISVTAKHQRCDRTQTA